MPSKIKCCSMDCKYNSPSYYCTYKGVVRLSDCYIATKYDGRQHFHRCKNYEQDESVEQMQKEIIDFFKEKKHE